MEERQRDVEILQQKVIEESKTQRELQQQIEKLNNTIKEKNKQLQSKANTKKVVKKVSVPLKTGGCYTAMRKHFPKSQWGNATTVINRESGGNARAVSRTDDHGCFQIHGGLSNHGAKIYDPNYNASLAYNHYFKNRGWSPWYCCRELW